MAWLALTVQTGADSIDDTAAMLTAAGFQELVLEDQNQFEDFLEENRACWDYIDEDLQEKLQGLSHIKLYLEAADINVVMTRTTDEGLYDENASNKKVQDMKNRIALMEECNADLVVSIHQNSYPKESVYGAQVFHADNEPSRLLACPQRVSLSPSNV